MGVLPLDLVDGKLRFAREHQTKRDLHDLHHAEEIKRIWKESSGRYGILKTSDSLSKRLFIGLL